MYGLSLLYLSLSSKPRETEPPLSSRSPRLYSILRDLLLVFIVDHDHLHHHHRPMTAVRSPKAILFRSKDVKIMDIYSCIEMDVTHDLQSLS